MPHSQKGLPMPADHTANTILRSAAQTFAIEAQALSALADGVNGDLAAALVAGVRAIHEAGGRVVTTGIGKSGHVARKIAATFASTGTPSYFVHPAEASHGDLGMIQASDVILALSWSGEAPELADLIAYSRRFGVTLIAVTSRADSALGQAADIALVLPRMPEACPNGLAPTTSTVMQMAAGDAIAVALLTLRGFSAQDFRQFHPGGKLGARLKKVGDLMHTGDRLPVVPLTAPLAEAIARITEKRFGVTAVVDDAGRLSGVITDGDLRRALARGDVGAPLPQVMTPAPQTISADELAQEALALMNDRAISSLFVLEDGRPIGILHLQDLLRAGLI